MTEKVSKEDTARRIKSLLDCNPGPPEDPDGHFSADYTTPTTYGGAFNGLTHAIQTHGPRNVDSGEKINPAKSIQHAPVIHNSAVAKALRPKEGN